MAERILSDSINKIYGIQREVLYYNSHNLTVVDYNKCKIIAKEVIVKIANDTQRYLSSSRAKQQITAQLTDENRITTSSTFPSANIYNRDDYVKCIKNEIHNHAITYNQITYYINKRYPLICMITNNPYDNNNILTQLSNNSDKNLSKTLEIQKQIDLLINNTGAMNNYR